MARFFPSNHLERPECGSNGMSHPGIKCSIMVHLVKRNLQHTLCLTNRFLSISFTPLNCHPPLVSRAGLLWGYKIIDMSSSSSGTPSRGNNRILEGIADAIGRIKQRLSALEMHGLPASAGAAQRGSPDARPARSRSRTTRTTVAPGVDQAVALQGTAQDVLLSTNYKAIKQLKDMVAEL